MNITMSSKQLNSEKTDEDPYYIYIFIFDNYIMKNYILICFTYTGKEIVATFRSSFYAIRYSWAPGNLKKYKHDTVK